MTSPIVDQLKTALSSGDRQALCTSVIPELLNAISAIAQTLRTSQHVSLVGSANAFGDEQLNVDVSTEKIVRNALSRCPSVITASSEEEPVEESVKHANVADDSSTSSGSERYTVAFDPLDGSSITAPNWTVGTIIGIWDGDSALSQQPNRKQVASLLGVYGPRTTAVLAVRVPDTEPLCIEIGFGSQGAQDCEIIRPSVRLAQPPFKTRYFAPANLRAAAESPKYMELINKFISDKYTLRYSGGLVPDIVHALVKGHGLYVSPVTEASQAKLRRLYELCPIALIIECAGGKAIDPVDGADILSRVLGNCDERAGLVCGTAEEVDAVSKALIGQ